MGIGNSKLNDVAPQIEKEAGIIHAGLKRHRKDIESMTHTVKSQHAHVQLLLQDISELERIAETTSSQNIVRAEFDTTRFYLTRKWQRNTKCLLASVQSSLECQCESLLMSYKTLNRSIFDIFNKYSIDVDSSDDANVDLCVFEYEKDIQTAYDLCKTSESEVDRLEKEVKYLYEDIKKTKHEKKEISNLEKDMEIQLHQCQMENKTLTEQAQTLHERVAELETYKLSTRKNIDELKMDKEVLERLVKDFKEHRPVSIQLYYQVKGDMTSKMIDALKSMLVTQMGVERNELQFIVCQNELDINPELPLLVFCISARSLGTDVSTVLQNLNVSSKVLVLIFHHKDIHALPNQSSERVLTGPEFKALGGIFDIAFLSDKEIYPCDMNQTAAVGIESVLRAQS